jgi:hypothetical protein
MIEICISHNVWTSAPGTQSCSAHLSLALVEELSMLPERQLDTFKPGMRDSWRASVKNQCLIHGHRGRGDSNARSWGLHRIVE